MSPAPASDGVRPLVPEPGVMLFVALEAALVPTAFVALTVKVYVTPFVRPGTFAHVVVPPTEVVRPPG